MRVTLKPRDTAKPGKANGAEQVEAFIAQHSKDRQQKMHALRKLLKGLAPDAEERISYGMPTLWQGRNLVHFAPAKHHLGLYPGAAAVEALKDELAGYETTKGSVHLSWTEPLPEALIRQIMAFNLQHLSKKKSIKEEVIGKPHRAFLHAPIPDKFSRVTSGVRSMQKPKQGGTHDGTQPTRAHIRV